jgi:hypothetical protein
MFQLRRRPPLAQASQKAGVEGRIRVPPSRKFLDRVLGDT